MARCKRGHDLTAPDAWYEFQGGRKRTCAECRKISEAKRGRRKNPMIPPPPQPLDGDGVRCNACAEHAELHTKEAA